jgi:hypothetical protein
MFSAKMWRRVIVAGLVFFACAVESRAQSVTVSTLPGSVTFSLTNGASSNPGIAPLSVTTTWISLPLGRTIQLYGYFSNASAALAHVSSANTANIAASQMAVAVNGGSAAAFDQTGPFGAASAARLLFSQTVTALTTTGSRTDALTLNVNLSNYQLPADSYTGTLRVRARVSP